MNSKLSLVCSFWGMFSLNIFVLLSWFFWIETAHAYLVNMSMLIDIIFVLIVCFWFYVSSRSSSHWSSIPKAKILNLKFVFNGFIIGTYILMTLAFFDCPWWKKYFLTNSFMSENLFQGLALSQPSPSLQQVAATAIEDSRVLIWHRDKLNLTIMGDQFLQAVFDHILGRHVVKKLMQVTLSLR